MAAISTAARRVPLPRTWRVRAADIGALLIANGLFIVGMWWRHGGLDRLTFKPDSEVSRLGRGELTATGCSLELRQVLILAEQLREESGGHFDVRRRGAAGGLDPSGRVKGWAVEEAAWILDAAGARNFAINAGGDILIRGEPQPGEPWRIGVRHPLLPDAVARVLELRGGRWPPQARTSAAVTSRTLTRQPQGRGG